MVLAAKTTGSTLSVGGLGSCNIYSSFVEDWDSGQFL
jgi:hypothetical protein